jgi:hypothetical protein
MADEDGCDAALIIDTHGRIADASVGATALLGRRLDALLGHAITSVMPQLPFAADTPGYNMAYAIFQGGHPDWQPHPAVTADGRLVRVEAALASALVNGARFITLCLRPGSHQLQGLS